MAVCDFLHIYWITTEFLWRYVGQIKAECWDKSPHTASINFGQSTFCLSLLKLTFGMTREHVHVRNHLSGFEIPPPPILKQNSSQSGLAKIQTRSLKPKRQPPELFKFPGTLDLRSCMWNAVVQWGFLHFSVAPVGERTMFWFWHCFDVFLASTERCNWNNLHLPKHGLNLDSRKACP